MKVAKLRVLSVAFLSCVMTVEGASPLLAQVPAGKGVGAVVVAACQNGNDDDGDGLTDHLSDPGCESFLDDDESNVKAPCEDGLDNDGDGLIDFGQDPGCSSIYDADEDRSLTQCQNGKDDDGDGLEDWKDPGCADPADNDETNVLFQCQNGKDDDGDGLVDLLDPDCENNPCKDDEGVPVQLAVVPVAECIDVKQDGSFVAHFGYVNSGTSSVTVPVGPKNNVSPGNQGQGQPTTFLTGLIKNVFTVDVASTSTVTWTIGSTSASASIATARCEGSSIECNETDNGNTQQGMDSTANRQRQNVVNLANRALSLKPTKALSAAANSYKKTAQAIYMQQWQDLWGRFPQVTQSCIGCASIDLVSDIQAVQARSRRLERLSRQAGAVLKKARGNVLKSSDKKLLVAAAQLDRKFQAESLKLPRFQSSCSQK